MKTYKIANIMIQTSDMLKYARVTINLYFTFIQFDVKLDKDITYAVILR